MGRCQGCANAATRYALRALDSYQRLLDVRRSMPRGGRRPGAGNKPLPPEKRAIPITVTLRPETLTKLNAAANAARRSRSSLLEEIIKKHLR
jgi:hypothetical protein